MVQASDTQTSSTSGMDPVYFDAILRPNRSLSPEGFRLLMTSFGVILLLVGGWFFMIGAWPVVGFMGLEIAFVYWCFKQNYKAGRTYETVHLTDRQLTIDHRNHWGEHRHWQFQPYWINVNLADPVKHDSQIRVRSHGQSVTIGSFLAPEERADFVAALRDALNQARSPDRNHQWPEQQRDWQSQ